MCFEKPRFMLLFETHVASEHRKHTITDTVERTIHGPCRLGPAPGAGAQRMAGGVLHLPGVLPAGGGRLPDDY